MVNASQQKHRVRILGGKYRRQWLSVLSVEGLRPTSDRVRETVFNWLGQELTGKRCLDLFAGSGALGFEAASRGADKVIMVEKDYAVYQQIVKNQRILLISEVSPIISDGLRFLAETREKFDIIFLDPPFQSNLLASALQLMPRLLKSESVVYIEADHFSDLSGWEIIRQGRAGHVMYGLLRFMG